MISLRAWFFFSYGKIPQSAKSSLVLPFVHQKKCFGENNENCKWTTYSKRNKNSRQRNYTIPKFYYNQHAKNEMIIIIFTPCWMLLLVSWLIVLSTDRLSISVLLLFNITLHYVYENLLIIDDLVSIYHCFIHCPFITIKSTLFVKSTQVWRHSSHDKKFLQNRIRN